MCLLCYLLLLAAVHMGSHRKHHRVWDSHGQVVDPETNKLLESFVVCLVPGEGEKENPKFTSYPLDLQPTSTSAGLTTHSVLSQELTGEELRSQKLTWTVSKLILQFPILKLWGIAKSIPCCEWAHPSVARNPNLTLPPHSGNTTGYRRDCRDLLFAESKSIQITFSCDIRSWCLFNPSKERPLAR